MYRFLFLFLVIANLGTAQEAQLVTQEKNLGLITTIVYSDDGRYIAFGSEGDHKVKVFDVQSGKMIGSLIGHESSVRAIDFSLDGNSLVSGDKDGRVYFWSLETWSAVDSADFSGQVTALSYHDSAPDMVILGTSNGAVRQVNQGWTADVFEIADVKGEVTSLSVVDGYVMVGSSSGRVNVFDGDAFEVVEIKAHKKAVTSVVGILEGGLFSASEDGTIVRWNLDGDAVQEYQGNEGGVYCMDYHADKGLIVSGGADKVIRLLDAATGELLHEFVNRVEDVEAGSVIDETVRDVAFSPDGNTIASSGFSVNLFKKVSSNDNVIRLWDVNRLQLYKTLEGEVNPIEAFCFHPVENRLVTMYNDVITIWDMNSGERFGTTELHERVIEKPVVEVVQEDENKGGGLTNAFNKFQDGNLIDDAVDKAQDKAEKAIKSLKKEEAYLVFSGQGNYFITYLPDDEIRLYEVINGVPSHLTPIYPDQGHISDIATDSQEKYIACAGSGEEAVSIMDCTTGDLVTKLRAKDLDGGGLLIEAKAVAFSPDGSLLGVAFGNGIVRVWSTGSWSLVFENTLRASLAGTAFLNFSEDGNQLFVKTLVGISSFDMTSWSLFGESTPKTQGQPLIIHTPSDFLVTQTKDRLYFADLVNNATVETATFNTDNISNVEINKHGLVGASFLNGEFRVWDPKTGLERFVMVGEGDNVIIKTPDNYYKVTKEGHELVTFRVGKDAYPFEQFDAKYNRPDIVLQAMNSEDDGLIALYELAYKKRLSKLGLTESDLSSDMHLPTITIGNLSELPIVTAGTEATLKVEMGDTKYALTSLHVWVNNVPVYGAKGMRLSGSESLLDIPIELGSGQNIVQVAVQNEKGAVSLKQTVQIESSAEVKPSLYIVAVGTSEYADSRFNLSYAAKDANDLAALANENENSLYEEVHELILTNEEVTTGNFDQVRDFLMETGVNDVVILFVAGHGVLDDQFDYYYGTHDMNFDSPKGTGLEYSKLEGVLDGIKARKKVLIMDTCHSGEVEKDEVEADNTTQEVASNEVVFRSVGNGVKEINSEGISPSEMMKELFADIRTGTGATVITSAGGAEYAMESAEWKNGLFTYTLLFGLRNGTADVDGDGKIMLSEIQQYTVEMVSILSGGLQVPTTRMQNIALDYQVW